jgi:hypothetical protein
MLCVEGMEKGRSRVMKIERRRREYDGKVDQVRQTARSPVRPKCMY